MTTFARATNGCRSKRAHRTLAAIWQGKKLGAGDPGDPEGRAAARPARRRAAPAVTPPTDVDALRALLARAPEPGPLRRPNAVNAFFRQWRQWRAEAADVLAALDGAGAEASPSAPEAPGVAQGARGADVPPMRDSPQRPTAAEVHAVAAALAAAHARVPSRPELVAALRARFGISRATAYRALGSARGDRPRRHRADALAPAGLQLRRG